MTTLGKLRHLSRCSSDTGRFAVLAIDHRDNLLASLNQHAPAPLTEAEFTAFKQQIMRHLLPESTAVLTDPAYGIGPGLAERTLTGRHGLLAPLEITNYDLHPSQREIRFIPHWSIAKIKRISGDGVKLLLPYHPEDDNAFDKQEKVSRIVDECALRDIPFFLEPIAYSLDPDKKLENTELRQIVVEMARVFSALGVDVLKMQFPIDASQSDNEDEWRTACEELNTASTVPWVLLSAGVDYPTFAVQTRIACQAGASGIIAGRALWTEAVTLQGQQRETFLQETAAARMVELRQICEEQATPWFQKVNIPTVESNWYETYEG